MGRVSSFLHCLEKPPKYHAWPGCRPDCSIPLIIDNGFVREIGGWCWSLWIRLVYLELNQQSHVSAFFHLLACFPGVFARVGDTCESTNPQFLLTGFEILGRGSTA